MVLCTTFLVLLSASLSRQHLAYPINFCNMASTCSHVGRAVCGSSPDGCSRRSFLDQCDMYEYNCDYGTQYDIVNCEEKCSCCENVVEASTNSYKREDDLETNTIINDMKSLDMHQHHLKLLLSKPETIFTTDKSTDCSKCGRPNTWATTIHGETRDFFRILNGV